ncbi:MAG: relaxase/mobilization nuclease domain-containing protein [Chitinophagaceae bacterium]|nr:relaxase/mobilization nuclease domain-containing protein [Chitinophagaceae bacterium]
MLAALNYNENKVKMSKAICLHAEGFLLDTNELSFTQKAKGFERLNERNERAKTKTLHISLNFDPSEKLSETKLKNIAATYINEIGFEDQPYLVYQHHDAGHPHIHIITTAIREDGTRINTHNIGRNQSEKARKKIEAEFNLIKAQSKKYSTENKIPNITGKVIYGKSETREAINTIVQKVLSTYLFTSLPEFNAILQRYGIRTDRGTTDSRVFKHHGLLFRILSENKQPVGVPIKSSLLTGKPILAELEKRFESHKVQRQKFIPSLRKTMEAAIAQHPKDLSALQATLATKNIHLLLRQSTTGQIYGITLIDENNKLVINGSDLGKAYSAAHLQKRLSDYSRVDNTNQSGKPIANHPTSQDQQNLLDLILTPEQEFNHTQGQFLKKKRKRKRKPF